MSSMEIGLMKAVSVSMYLGIENIKIQEINGYDDPSKYYIAVFAKNQQNTVPFSIGKTLNFHLPTGKQLVEERRHYFLVEMIVFFSRIV